MRTGMQNQHQAALTPSYRTNPVKTVKPSFIHFDALQQYTVAEKAMILSYEKNYPIILENQTKIQLIP